MENIPTLSSPAGLKAYFEGILKLAHSGNEFPVKLDDVWPLAYGSKHKAVYQLKMDFLENIDFSSFTQKVESKESAKFPRFEKTDYMISVPCLEWFIARKVRDVFEVYRKVFHAAYKQSAEAAGLLSGLEVVIKKADGSRWMWYTQVLRALGLSTKSGSVSGRRRAYPMEFVHRTGQSADLDFISVTMAMTMAYRAMELQMRREIRDRMLSAELDQIL